MNKLKILLLFLSMFIFGCDERIHIVVESADHPVKIIIEYQQPSPAPSPTPIKVEVEKP